MEDKDRKTARVLHEKWIILMRDRRPDAMKIQFLGDMMCPIPRTIPYAARHDEHIAWPYALKQAKEIHYHPIPAPHDSLIPDDTPSLPDIDPKQSHTFLS